MTRTQPIAQIEQSKAAQILKRKAISPMKTPIKQQNFSAKQAAKEVKKATSTITRAIKTGKLSAKKNDNGDWEIQASELFRVYPANENGANTKTQSANTETETDNNSKLLEIEIKHLRERLIDKESSLEDKNEVIEDLRKRLDKAFLMVEHQKPQSETNNFLPWFIPPIFIIALAAVFIAFKSFQ